MGSMQLVRLSIPVLLLVCVEASILHYIPGMGYLTGSNRDHKQQLETTWPPAFCNKLDCPKYTVIEQNKDYELREYEVSNWVSISQKDISWKQSQYSMFMKLFKYISGENKDKKKITMTAPVIDRIIPGQGPACEDDFTMSFFVSPTEGAAPQPSDPTVSLTELTKQRVYVRAFGGYAMFSFDPWAAQAAKLAEAIGDTSKYHSESYYTAGYDSPARIFNRHNEIWFIAK